MVHNANTSERVKVFVQRVLQLSSPSTDIGGSVIPSLSGAVSARTEIVQQLHRDVIACAQSFNSQNNNAGRPEYHTTVQLAADQVEASLMAAITLNVLDEAAGTELIDELHDLTDANTSSSTDL